MTKLKFWILFSLIFCFCNSFATSVERIETTILSVSDVKWVYLKFLSDVKYADMGTDDIQLERTSVSSILRIRSLVPLFDKTSITVITLDGVVHTFDLHYATNPPVQAYEVKGNALEEIPSYRVDLSHRQTSHIVFPTKILDVTVGSDSIIADLADGIDNIIKCKSLSAGFDYFEESSLTVITEDHLIYPFVIRYEEYPSIINYHLAGEKTRSDALFSSLSINEPAMQLYGQKVLDQGCVLRNYGVINNKMSFSLQGIFVHEDVMMFSISVENLSKIDYEIDFIKNYVVNKKTTKNQASQADERVPLFTYSESTDNTVQAGGSYRVVFFFKRFTIPTKHSLYFEIFEKNGGRHLKFTIPHKAIFRAKQLS